MDSDHQLEFGPRNNVLALRDVRTSGPDGPEAHGSFGPEPS